MYSISMHTRHVRDVEGVADSQTRLYANMTA